jgi:ferredoxin
MKRSAILRYPLKVLLLAAAPFCLLEPVSVRLAGILPASSPFVIAASAISGRGVIVFYAVCIPVLLLVLIKKRRFCNYVCPTGLVLEWAGKLRGKEARGRFASFPRLGKWLVFISLGGAIVGYPLMIWLDPLAQLNAFMTFSRAGMAGMAMLVLVSVIRPNLWCGRVCPLGGFQELVIEAGKPEQALGRRAFMGIAAGGIIGGATRALGGRSDVIRPPGALPESRFTGVCSRCGTCSAVCPSGIISPDMGESGIAGFMTPVVTIGKTYCLETCSRCAEVCPTNAIRHNTLAKKQNIQIGLAEVIKKECLCWGKRETCMVCADYCPYGAVKRESVDGLDSPLICEMKCRGCGACELVCPAGKLAIVVKGRPQRELEPVDVQEVHDFIHVVS